MVKAGRPVPATWRPAPVASALPPNRYETCNGLGAAAASDAADLLTMVTALERGDHGSATTWRQGCRCRRCRTALRLSARVWWATRQVRRGRDPASHVAPARLRQHLDELAVAGLSAREVARRAGVSPATLTRARRPGVKVSRIVERQVLAVKP